MTSRLAALLFLGLAARASADPWVDPRSGHGWVSAGTGISQADTYLTGPGEIDLATFTQPLPKGTRQPVKINGGLGVFGFVQFDARWTEVQAVLRGEVALYRGLGFALSMPYLRRISLDSDAPFGTINNTGVGDLTFGFKYQIPIPARRAYGFAFGPQVYFTAPTGDSRGAAPYPMGAVAQPSAAPATTGEGSGAIEVRLSAGYRSTRVPLFVTAELGYRHHLVSAPCRDAAGKDAKVTLSDDLPYAVHAGAEWTKHWRAFDHLRVSADLGGVRSAENHDVPTRTGGPYLDGCVQNNNVSRFSIGGTLAWFPIRIFGISYSISHVLAGVNTAYSLDQNVALVFEVVMTEEAEVSEAYRRMGHLVRARCRRLLRDDVTADDALQEAFVRMWRFLPSYREATSKLAWIYRVSDRCCFDLLARRRTRREDELAHDHLGVASATQGIEDRDLALRLLAELDDEAQRIVVLFYVDEMSQGEIADALGCSRQTVNKKLGDVRARLGLRAIEVTA